MWDLQRRVQALKPSQMQNPRDPVTFVAWLTRKDDIQETLCAISSYGGSIQMPLLNLQKSGQGESVPGLKLCTLPAKPSKPIPTSSQLPTTSTSNSGPSILNFIYPTFSILNLPLRFCGQCVFMGETSWSSACMTEKCKSSQLDGTKQKLTPTPIS